MNAMNTDGMQKPGAVKFMNHVTPELVSHVMGIEASAFSPIAWLVIQEEAANVTREDMAKTLQVEVAQINELVELTTGKTGEEAESIWMRGVISIQAANHMSATQIAQGWDAVEAMAVDKLARNLQAMSGYGNAADMLDIATKANKAIRRKAGEGQVGNKRNPESGTEASVTLQAGNLGTLRLTLAPAVREQLANPERQIEAIANNAKTAAEKTVGKDLGLQRMGLLDTRALIEEKSTLDKNKFDTSFDEIFGNND